MNNIIIYSNITQEYVTLTFHSSTKVVSDEVFDVRPLSIPKTDVLLLSLFNICLPWKLI